VPKGNTHPKKDRSIVLNKIPYVCFKKKHIIIIKENIDEAEEQVNGVVVVDPSINLEINNTKFLIVG